MSLCMQFLVQCMLFVVVAGASCASATHQAAWVACCVCGGCEGDQWLPQHRLGVLQRCLAGINAAKEPLQQLLTLAIEHSAATGLLLL